MATLLFPFLAGVFVTLQNSLNGLMTLKVSAILTAMIGFTVQLLVLQPMIRLGRGDRKFTLRIPLRFYFSGFLAVVIVGGIGFCVSRMGSAVSTCCSVAGQVIMSAVVDHFALFGARKNRFRKERIPGFIVILAGVLIMNLSDRGEGGVTIPLLLFALCLGAFAIIVRSLNYQASKATGSVIGGGIVNSLSGMVGGLIAIFLLTDFRKDLSMLGTVQPVCYLAGVLGVACMLCNIVAYKRQNVFYATIFTLIGQVGTGIVMDIFVFHALSAIKCIGVVLVLAGVLLDKIVTRRLQS